MNVYGKQAAFDLLYTKIVSGINHMAVISDSRFTRYNGPYGRAAFWHLSSSIGPTFGGIAGGGWVSPSEGTSSTTIQQSQQPFGVGFYTGGCTATENLTSQGPVVINDDSIPFNFRRVSIPLSNTARFYPDKWYTAFGASNSAPIFNITQGPITSLKMRALCDGQSSGGFGTIRWTYPNTSNVSDVPYAALTVDAPCVIEHTKAVTVQDTDPAVGDGVAAQYRIQPVGAGTDLKLYASQWLNGDANRGLTITTLSAGGAALDDMLAAQTNAGDVLDAAGFGIVNIISGANNSADYRGDLIALIDWLNTNITSNNLLIFVHQSCYTPGIAHVASLPTFETIASEVALGYDNVIACDTYSHLDSLGINSGADAWLDDSTDGLFQVDQVHFLDQAGQYYWADGVGQGIKDAVAKAEIPNNRTMLDLANMITGTGTSTPQFTTDSTDLIDTKYAELSALIAAIDVSGSGSISKTLTVTDIDSNPLDGVAVWISTDSAGLNVVAGTRYTDALGKVTFMLDAGTYYAWQQRTSYNFTNPTSFTVSS